MDREGMIYIACAGEGKRWGLAYPKFLAPFNGVPNLYRTVRMLRDRPYRVSVQEAHTGYVGNLPYIIGAPTPEKARFTNFPLQIRDVLLYGDVMYFEPDLASLLSAPPDSALLRLGRNPTTGKGYGEIFGFAIGPKILNAIDTLPPEGRGWDIISPRKDVNGVEKPPQPRNGIYEALPIFHLLIASDLTDDYDSVEEYERLRGVSETGLAHNQHQGGSTPPSAPNTQFVS